MTEYQQTYEDSLQMDVLNDIAQGLPWLMLTVHPVNGSFAEFSLVLRTAPALEDTELLRVLLQKTLAALPAETIEIEDEEDEFYD